MNVQVYLREEKIKEKQIKDTNRYYKKVSDSTNLMINYRMYTIEDYKREWKQVGEGKELKFRDTIKIYVK